MEVGSGRGQKSRKEEDKVSSWGFSQGKEGIFPNFRKVEKFGCFHN